MNKKILLFVSLLLCSMTISSFASVPIVFNNTQEILHKKSFLPSDQSQPPLISSLTSKYIEITPLIFDLNQLAPAFQNGQVDFFLVNGKCGHLPKTEPTS